MKPVKAFFVLTLFLAGCASIPDAPPAQREQAALPAPPPGKAGIYLIRDWNFVGALVNFGVEVDFNAPANCAPIKHDGYRCLDTFPVPKDYGFVPQTFAPQILAQNSGGFLETHSYLYAAVDPGTHVIGTFFARLKPAGDPDSKDPYLLSNTQGRSSIDFHLQRDTAGATLEAGKNYFFHLDFHSLKNKVQFTPDPQGAEKILKYKQKAYGSLVNFGLGLYTP